jgi:hypothetical protein
VQKADIAGTAQRRLTVTAEIAGANGKLASRKALHSFEQLRQPGASISASTGVGLL